MEARGNWIEVSEYDAIDQANFIFKPTKFGQYVSKTDELFNLYVLNLGIRQTISI